MESSYNEIVTKRKQRILHEACLLQIAIKEHDDDVSALQAMQRDSCVVDTPYALPPIRKAFNNNSNMSPSKNDEKKDSCALPLTKVVIPETTLQHVPDRRARAKKIALDKLECKQVKVCHPLRSLLIGNNTVAPLSEGPQGTLRTLSKEDELDREALLRAKQKRRVKRERRVRIAAHRIQQETSLRERAERDADRHERARRQHAEIAAMKSVKRTTTLLQEAAEVIDKEKRGNNARVEANRAEKVIHERESQNVARILLMRAEEDRTVAERERAKAQLDHQVAREALVLSLVTQEMVRAERAAERAAVDKAKRLKAEAKIDREKAMADRAAVRTEKASAKVDFEDAKNNSMDTAMNKVLAMQKKSRVKLHANTLKGKIPEEKEVMRAPESIIARWERNDISLSEVDPKEETSSEDSVEEEVPEDAHAMVCSYFHQRLISVSLIQAVGRGAHVRSQCNAMRVILHLSCRVPRRFVQALSTQDAAEVLLLLQTEEALRSSLEIEQEQSRQMLDPFAHSLSLPTNPEIQHSEKQAFDTVFEGICQDDSLLIKVDIDGLHDVSQSYSNDFGSESGASQCPQELPSAPPPYAPPSQTMERAGGWEDSPTYYLQELRRIVQQRPESLAESIAALVEEEASQRRTHSEIILIGREEYLSILHQKKILLARMYSLRRSHHK